MFRGPQEVLALLAGRTILVGVGGGIAAYKTASVVSTLAQAGASVHVVMTPSATRFVTPLTFEALSGRPVHHDIWEQADRSDPQHIRLAANADAMLVAPCTMDLLARIVHGFTDDPVSLVVSAIDRDRTPVLLAPSMNAVMWAQPSTQRNIEQARADHFGICAPGEGWQACRTSGPGRLPEPDELVEGLAMAIRARHG